ncbi:MAG: heptaprenyl diphosphate synthase [Peptococcaceae bacterium BICA1-8]|nr:MAG: heptaprenyl diphosphate synthase [Peptococcaceae bacterium BICA1-8]
MTKSRKITLLGLLIAQALALHVIERFVPMPIPIPGVKLGLANIITLFTIIILGFKEAVLVVIVRTFLGSLFAGGPSSFLFSIIGGLFSTVIMSMLYKWFYRFFSIPTISIAGAVAHNIGQIAVASFIVSNLNLFYYLPALIISGVITGLFIGLAVQFALKPLKIILRIQ